MKKLIRPLAITAVLGVVGVLGTGSLSADAPKPAAAPPAATPAPAAPADTPMTPVKVTDVKVDLKYAVTPKPLSPAVKRGLEYLIKHQQEDGGWNQGGGWRVNTAGSGRVEGKGVEDPSDVGNTCFAVLALLRAGNTPTSGEYKDAVARGLKFILGRVEKADKDSLYVTDVKGTQLQSKIGPYVDTFLVNLTLAELRGKGGAEEKRLTACLEKTMNKIVKHQQANGGFANNGGWAPTLSMAICNKGIARAKQNGVMVDDKVLARAFDQSRAAAGGPVAAAPPAAGVPAAPAPGRPATTIKPAPTGPAVDRPAGEGTLARGAGLAAPGFSGGGFSGGGGDAGVKLYSFGQGAGNTQDIVNSLRVDAEKAKKILADSKAGDKDKKDAQQKLDGYKWAEMENGRVQQQLAANVREQSFVAGFGSNGGEEFLSFLNISEALLIKGGKDWTDWDKKMATGLEKAQDKEGSWNGQHCITGKTFCTAGALLVLMADRTQFPPAALIKSEVKPDQPKPAPAPTPAPPAKP